MTYEVPTSLRNRVFCVDFDDYCDATINELVYLKELKQLYPQFKCTLFTIPMRTSKAAIDEVAMLNTSIGEQWIKLAPHGWYHTRGECLSWTSNEAIDKIEAAKEMGIDEPIFRAPGWLLDGEVYLACSKLGYAVASHKDIRIPSTGVPEYVYNNPIGRLKSTRGVHGHMTPVSDNYIKDMSTDGRLAFPSTNDFIHLTQATVIYPTTGEVKVS